MHVGKRKKDVTIHVISHTHWDREWYRTNQEFRVELVSVVDAVIDALQRQEGFYCFTLDGQAILLEDYLAMRPEQTEIVRTLVRGGNLLVGPWYTQPDEFLVSGESLVRNLQAGTQTAALHGGTMRVGWVPDAFGHIAQLPQILRHFDIDCAALTRGIGNELPEMETDFVWESPDGSSVFVAHQVQGYYSGGLLGFPYFWGSTYSRIPSVEIAKERLLRLVEPGGKKPRSSHVALWNGADHLHPEPDLAHTLDRLEEIMPGYRIIHSNVPEYARGVRRERPELPVVTGELRGSRYHPLLPSILSSRIHLKQRNAAVQRLFERQTEPIAVMASLMAPFAEDADQMPRYYYPAHALREGWKLLLQNHGHDSIGGCSIDQVHKEMLPRFDQAEQIARAVCSIGIRQVASAVATDWVPESRPVFVCFSPFDRPGIHTVRHEFVWSEELGNGLQVVDRVGEVMPTQLLDVRKQRYLWLETRTNSRDVADNAWWWNQVLHRMDRLGIHRFKVEDDSAEARLLLFLADESACRDDTLVELVQSFRGRLADSTVAIEAIYYRHRLAFAASLPPLSVTTFSVAVPPGAGDAQPVVALAPVRAVDNKLHFGGNVLTVEPDAGLTLRTSSGREYIGIVSFYDEGDCGDTYDFSPAADGPIPLRPEGEVAVTPEELGPVTASLEAVFSAQVPAGLAKDHRRRSAQTTTLAVRFCVSVQTGSDLVRVDGSLTNNARDHRVRAKFSAKTRATHVVSEGTFSVEKRPIAGPETAGWAQSVTSTRPHQGWVAIGDKETAICVHTDGLHEHEALQDTNGPVAGTHSLAITLLRCVGWLSRGDLDTRRGQAGPMIATPDAQQLGLNRFRFAFAVMPGLGYLDPARCTAGPAYLETVTAPAGPGRAGLDHQIRLLDLNTTSFALTALKGSIRVPGAIVVRLFNTSHAPIVQSVGVSRLFDRATRVRLDELPIEDEEIDDGIMTLAAGPAEIVTIRLERAPQHRILRGWKRDQQPGAL